MSQIDTVFVTKIYRAMLRGRGIAALIDDLAATALSFSEDDTAGKAWSREKGYAGYTSYASPGDLTWRAPAFADLAEHLDAHVAMFVKDLDFDIGREPLQRDSMWINILEPGGSHAAHIHPHAVISGTFYVDVPDGAGAIRFEDPRHAMMMAAPPRKPKARRENRSHVQIAPKAGMVVLWESWLRHEVPRNDADAPRISVSFNYRWSD